jgi:hypothetical protein
VNQEQKPRERSFVSELVPDWRPTRGQVLWAIRMTILIAALLVILTLIGLPFGVSLWEWVKLLIVPAAIAAGGIWFNQQQREREQDIAQQRARDAALQAYLDQMGQLLLDKDRPLRESKQGDEVQTLARARTLSVLSQLDGRRKGHLIQFLSEAKLIQGKPGMGDAHHWRSDQPPSWAHTRPVIGLTSADLSDAYLKDADLSRVILSEANLTGANLRRADLREAILWDADLTDADLSGALVTWEQLNSCVSLEGATMPGRQRLFQQPGSFLEHSGIPPAS